MADFKFLFNGNNSSVDEILSEAMDRCTLEQIAAINCASFSNSSLPSNLESRFQRLKTFPSTSSTSKSTPQLARDSVTQFKNSERERNSQGKSLSGYVSSSSNSSNSPNLKAKSCDGMIKQRKSRSGYVSSPSNSSNFKAKSGDGMIKEGKSRSGLFSFCLNSSDSSMKMGCLRWFPKRVLRKKSSDSDTMAKLGLDFGNYDDILSDLKSFSSEEKKKMVKVAMKEAMKEAEKIRKETRKIVKQAKESAKLDFSFIDDELSADDDDYKGHNFGLH